MSYLFAIVTALGIIFGIAGGAHALYEIGEFEQQQSLSTPQEER